MTATKTYGFPLVTPAQWVTVNAIAADLELAPAISLSTLGENPPAVMVEFWDNDHERLTTVNIEWDGHITSSETWSDRLGNVDNQPEAGADLGGLAPSAVRFVSIGEEPILGAISSNGDVHWRLYLDNEGTPDVVCVHTFYYDDYSAERFVDAIVYGSASEATAGLSKLLTAVATSPTFYADRLAATVLKTAGSPLTRRQALLAYLV